MGFELNAEKYEGTLFTVNHYAKDDGGTWSIASMLTDQYPEMTINGVVLQEPEPPAYQ